MIEVSTIPIIMTTMLFIFMLIIMATWDESRK